MSIRRVLKRLIVTVGVLAILLVGLALWGVYLIIEPDSDKFGNVKDEAMAAGVTRKHLVAAADPYFVEMDKGDLAEPILGQEGQPQYPDGIASLAKTTGLDPETIRQHAIKGQNTWTVWTGGNDRFWDDMTSLSIGTFDLLKLLSSHPSQGYGRRNRWHYLGLVNEPCFQEATAESAAKNEFGLWLDVRDEGCALDPFADAERYPGVETGARGKTLTLNNGKQVTLPVGSYYGLPSGIVGLRLFPNPNFDADAAKRWDPERFYTDPDYYFDRDLVRPYRVGMSCAFCHVGPSPVNPPPNPEAPEWENLNSNPGAQYFWVNRIFVWDTAQRSAPDKPSRNEHSFIYQLFHTNPPGSLDTSLVSTDYINNPRTMNAVYSVGARLAPTLRWGKEHLTGGELDNKQFQDYPQTEAFANFWNENTGEVKTARVLKDGSDSAGILAALNRVYLNIGLFSEEWTLHFRPIFGAQKISPIRVSDAVKNSAYWGATEDQTADMAIFFLVSATPDDLADAPGGASHLSNDQALLQRGRLAFADNCAACHSSKIPPAPDETGVDSGVCKDGGNGPHYRECWDRYWGWVQTEEFKREMRKIVNAPDFLEDNFLSTERRVPVDLLGTNACSPLATNALEDDIWDNFSSTSYKELPPVGELTVHHPISGGVSAFQPLGAGRGYTRPASLVSLWSTAPFLLNNSVGHEDYPYTAGGSYRSPTHGQQGYGYPGGYAGEQYSENAGTYGQGEPGGHGQESGYGQGESGGYGQTQPGGYGQAEPGGYGEAEPDTGYDYAARCPASDNSDPYLPCVDNRMRVFNDSIRKMLYPERRRVDSHTRLPVPGYMYRATAPNCVQVPKGYLWDIFGDNANFFHWLAPWVFDEAGNIALGPLPEGFPVNTLSGVELLPDHDAPNKLGHYWSLLKAGPTLLSTFKKLGGTCSEEELKDPATQEHAERVLHETGLVDTLVGLNKCPDYVVNRGHYFGTDLSDADKEALIEFLKFF